MKSNPCSGSTTNVDHRWCFRKPTSAKHVREDGKILHLSYIGACGGTRGILLVDRQFALIYILLRQRGNEFVSLMTCPACCHLVLTHKISSAGLTEEAHFVERTTCDADRISRDEKRCSYDVIITRRSKRVHCKIFIVQGRRREFRHLPHHCPPPHSINSRH